MVHFAVIPGSLEALYLTLRAFGCWHLLDDICFKLKYCLDMSKRRGIGIGFNSVVLLFALLRRISSRFVYSISYLPLQSFLCPACETWEIRVDLPFSLPAQAALADPSTTTFRV